MSDTPLVRSPQPVNTLHDLTPDPRNANRGTDRGRVALETSLRTYGAGRSVLIDRAGVVIAGNMVVDEAKRLNLPLRVVNTDGTFLIAVQRDDLELATDPRAQALAIADNRVGELNSNGTSRSSSSWSKRASTCRRSGLTTSSTRCSPR